MKTKRTTNGWQVKVGEIQEAKRFTSEGEARNIAYYFNVKTAVARVVAVDGAFVLSFAGDYLVGAININGKQI